MGTFDLTTTELVEYTDKLLDGMPARLRDRGKLYGYIFNRQTPNGPLDYTGASKQLAKACDLSTAFISELMKRGTKGRSTLSRMARIAIHLEVSVAWLMLGEEPAEVRELDPSGRRYRLGPRVFLTRASEEKPEPEAMPDERNSTGRRQ